MNGLVSLSVIGPDSPESTRQLHISYLPCDFHVCLYDPRAKMFRGSKTPNCQCVECKNRAKIMNRQIPNVLTFVSPTFCFSFLFRML